ncbi:MAG: tetraacyldisaccharide 4'-kinase [Ignavibacteriaceae bacterium]
MKLLKIILLPFLPVYALIVGLRNIFFDTNIFKSRKVDAKIISVGNLTVGGSGKTPMVIYLLNLLKKEGMLAGVLSRGYGRKSRGYVLVSNNGKILSTVDQCGDEIFHTVKETKAPAAVSENRVKGAIKLIKETGIKVIVLDDAFQHRWIYRNVNILLFEQRFLTDTGLFNQSLLPSGLMREPFSSIKRADAIIINRKFSEIVDIPVNLRTFFNGIINFTASYEAIGFVDIKKQTFYKIEEFEGQKSLVVSGIANPFSFINALKQTKVDTQKQILFRDHKNYTLKEVHRIRKEFYDTNSHSVVTTEKDAVKLYKFSKELDDIDIFYLKIQINIDDEKSFKEFLFNKLSTS